MLLLDQIQNLLRYSEVNEKSPSSSNMTKCKLVSADFLPSTQVVVKKQGSSF